MEEDLEPTCCPAEPLIVEVMEGHRGKTIGKVFMDILAAVPDSSSNSSSGGGSGSGGDSGSYSKSQQRGGKMKMNKSGPSRRYYIGIITITSHHITYTSSIQSVTTWLLLYNHSYG